MGVVLWVLLVVFVGLLAGAVVTLGFGAWERYGSRPVGSRYPLVKREAWQDVEVTYAAARAALPDSIREDFHPDWPWLDVNDVPRVKNEVAAYMRRSLRGPDADLFEVWDYSTGGPI